MSLLSITNLSVAIHRFNILQGVTLSVDAGEIVAVTGESGSGKSMTALAAMQLLPKGTQARGHIMLGDQDLLALPESELCAIRGNDIGMVFQEPMTALNPVLRVGEQIEEVLNMHSDLSRAEAKARTIDMMEQVHLPDVERIYAAFPHQLSGGQRQRIMIAMALILDPDLLIADEPTTALDVTTQLQLSLIHI